MKVMAREEKGVDAATAETPTSAPATNGVCPLEREVP